MLDVNTIRKEAADLLPELIAIRRHLHMYPEISFEEHETSAFIKSVLNKHGIVFTEGWVKTGIVATIGDVSNDHVALRADMDALPIQEKNDCLYKSVNDGLMHACGHDVHTTIALGTAILLKKYEKTLNAGVKIIFQPGEEKLPGGASLMIKEGALGNPLPKAIVGLHVFPEMEVGKTGFRIGEYMASSDEIYLTIKGKGGHAAMKGQYINPILMAAEVITTLEQQFNAANKQNSVLAFGKIEGLGATNVIPDEVKIQGTFRAMDEAWRKTTHEMIGKATEEICAKYKGSCDVDIRKGYPVLVNHEDVTKICKSAAEDILGKENIEELPVRMTAEDFAYYGQVIPACFFRLGTANREQGITSPVHTATFDVDEKALEIGVKTMARIVLKLS